MPMGFYNYNIGQFVFGPKGRPPLDAFLLANWMPVWCPRMESDFKARKSKIKTREICSSEYYFKACRKGDPEAKAVTVNESPMRAITDASEITGLPRDNFEIHEISKDEFYSLEGK
jgi:hypothetical protein